MLVRRRVCRAAPVRPGGLGQTTDTEELERETTEAEEPRQAAGQALDVDTLSGAPVSYQDVLADPDNLELNLRFARTQVAQGNVRGAAATLERILLIDPDWGTASSPPRRSRRT